MYFAKNCEKKVINFCISEREREKILSYFYTLFFYSGPIGRALETARGKGDKRRRRRAKVQIVQQTIRATRAVSVTYSRAL